MFLNIAETALPNFQNHPSAKLDSNLSKLFFINTNKSYVTVVRTLIIKMWVNSDNGTINKTFNQAGDIKFNLFIDYLRLVFIENTSLIFSVNYLCWRLMNN